MSKLYDDYLLEHKNNVAKGYKWLLENLPELFEDVDIDSWEFIYAHDASKSTEEEYDAYDEYFYGRNKSFEVVQNFNKAWLHHIHNNPHHWQYWILMNDDPNPLEREIYIDIPYQYIIEMICDWWSFSWKEDNLYEIFDWYRKHKDNIRMSQQSRFQVEEILDKIKEKLDEVQ